MFWNRFRVFERHGLGAYKIFLNDADFSLSGYQDSRQLKLSRHASDGKVSCFSRPTYSFLNDVKLSLTPVREGGGGRGLIVTCEVSKGSAVN